MDRAILIAAPKPAAESPGKPQVGWPIALKFDHADTVLELNFSAKWR